MYRTPRYIPSWHRRVRGKQVRGLVRDRVSLANTGSPEEEEDDSGMYRSLCVSQEQKVLSHRTFCEYNVSEGRSRTQPAFP